MRGNDAILALLQDIKEILYGIALLIPAAVFCLTGAMFLDTWGIFLLAAGIMLGFAGGMYARHGFHHHEVAEHEDTSSDTHIS